MQEIHTIFGEVIDQGIVKTTKESKVSIWPFPQEDKINVECLSFDEEGTLEPKYYLSLNSDYVRILKFNERSRDITNEKENIEYISHIEIWFQEGTRPRYHPLLQCLLLLNQAT